jgi:hypothetical protein
VASQLVGMLGRPTTTLPALDTNKKLYVQKLARWVLEEAAQVPAMHWFILDNFRGDQLLPETRDFLVALSDRITTGIQSRRCRLILIGFDRALLSVDAGRLHEDLVAPCTVQEVKTGVAEVAGTAPVPLDVALLEAFVLEGLPGREGRMAEINARLSLLVHAIEALAAILAPVAGADFQVVLLKLLENLPAGVRERKAEMEQRLRVLKEAAEGRSP